MRKQLLVLGFLGLLVAGACIPSGEAEAHNRFPRIQPEIMTQVMQDKPLGGMLLLDTPAQQSDCAFSELKEHRDWIFQQAGERIQELRGRGAINYAMVGRKG